VLDTQTHTHTHTHTHACKKYKMDMIGKDSASIYIHM
jgi:hypothetical protein